jgi:hypothetical protein
MVSRFVNQWEGIIKPTEDDYERKEILRPG